MSNKENNNQHEHLIIYKIKNDDDIEINTYVSELEFKTLEKKVKEQRRNLHGKETAINNLNRIISNQIAMIKKFSELSEALISEAGYKSSKAHELSKLIKQTQLGEIIPDVRDKQIKKVKKVLADILKAVEMDNIEAVVKSTREALEECYR